MGKFKPKLLLKKRYEDMTSKEIRFYLIIMNGNQYGYESERDLLTNEVSLWRVKPYG